MDTKEQIIAIANNLIIANGYNAFSYHDIAKTLGIKTSSIHYHFPTKSNLGIAVIQNHQYIFHQTIMKTKEESALKKLNKLFAYYKQLITTQKVCIVGALTSDINTLDTTLKEEVLVFSKQIIKWTTEILKEGQTQKIFKPIQHTTLKAKQIVISLMALVQVARIENSQNDFNQMTKMILNELLIKK
ncbi:MAG: TetR/AcrR family transcriptional regulator [Chitinophagales bacterium]|nr:TetR/AcrR family transcriptional regulator [Chitinophagales bacterium]